MNEFVNHSQRMEICENCPNFWVRQRKTICETWTDEETHEFCARSQFELVCEHYSACERAVRLSGRQR